jgi:photosystem II stability/assembly factor-like uncharacterized protein
MSPARARPAKSRPGRGCSGQARLGTDGSFLPAALCAAVLAWAGTALAAPPPPDTDTAIWRAQHGLLLGLSHAGTGTIVAVGNAGHILLSDDQGKTWQLAKSPTDELLTAVIFPTPQEGWAVGQDEVVLHSIDAGRTWTQQHIKPAADQVLFTIISLASGTAPPGHLFASGSYNLILETQDGKKWVESKIPNLDDDYHLNCAVNRGDDIMITGEAGHAFIRYAGAWTAMKLPYDGSQFACLVGPDGSFYSFGLRGTAFRALPGARAWTKLDSATQKSFFGATTLSDGRMALVGGNGLLDLLDPKTGKMTVLPPPTGSTISAVLQNADGKLVLAGEDGIHIVDPAMTADAGVGQ